MKHLMAFVFAVFLITFTQACDDNGAVTSRGWLIPNSGSEDLLHTFTTPADWSKAFDRTEIFGFYVRNLICFNEGEAGCESQGINVIKNFMQTEIFKQIRVWQKKTAVVTKVMGETDNPCEVDHFLTNMAFDHIKDMGGFVNMVIVDRPLTSYKSCKASFADSVKGTIDFAQIMRLYQTSRFETDGTSVNDFKVAIHESLGDNSVEEIKSFLSGIVAKSTVIGFFNLHIDREKIKELGWSTERLNQALTDLSNYTKSLNLEFGVIFTDENAVTDTQYANNTLSLVSEVKAAIGEPKNLVFQSWAKKSSIPTNTPDSDDTTHSGIILRALSILEK